MKIDSQTALYGVFGNPVQHSLSPRMHNALFKKHEINAVYLAFEIQVGALGLAFEGIRSLGIKGVNLTIPFKEDAINFIDEIPEDIDRSLGALNTVVNRDGVLYGYNTDGPGFLMSLKEELQFNPEGKKILVLGAGGAARGVSFALALARADKVMIHNRTHERAEGLVEHLAKFFPDNDFGALTSLDDLKHEKIDLVVNATSSGLKESDASPMDLKILDQPTKVYDLIYSVAQTKLLKQAKSLGFANANGLGMLVAQGALSFALWTGEKENVRESMLEALRA